MLRFATFVTLAALSITATPCRASQQSGGPSTGIGERAAMILHYPHDEHVFGELPPNLTPVLGASAHLVRGDDELRGVFQTTMAPGHVGKLLAVVINNPSACKVPTPVTACGPHEEEFNARADGGFYLGEGAVADRHGALTLRISVVAGDTTNLLCGWAANPAFDSCGDGFALRDAQRAEVTLVLLDNGPSSDDPDELARQLASARPCADCPPFTEQVALGFGREPPRPR